MAFQLLKLLDDDIMKDAIDRYSNYERTRKAEVYESLARQKKRPVNRLSITWDGMFVHMFVQDYGHFGEVLKFAQKHYGDGRVSAVMDTDISLYAPMTPEEFQFSKDMWMMLVNMWQEEQHESEA